MDFNMILGDFVLRLVFLSFSCRSVIRTRWWLSSGRWSYCLSVTTLCFFLTLQLLSDQSTFYIWTHLGRAITVRNFLYFLQPKFEKNLLIIFSNFTHPHSSKIFCIFLQTLSCIFCRSYRMLCFFTSLAAVKYRTKYKFYNPETKQHVQKNSCNFTFFI